MGRARTGNIFERDGKLYARVTYVGEDGKRHARWRRAQNITHAKTLIPELLTLIGANQNGYAKVAPPARRGFIYAMRMEIPGATQCPIKIGFSISVEDRKDTLATGSPYPISILGFWETARADLEERKLHQEFASSRLRGEWFTPTEELIETIRKRTALYRTSLEKRVEALGEFTG